MLTPERVIAEADDLVAVEDEAADASTAAFRRRLESIVAMLTAGWVEQFGSHRAPGVGPELADLLARVLSELRSALAAAVVPARTAVLAAIAGGTEQGLIVAEDAYPHGFGVAKSAKLAAEPDGVVVTAELTGGGRAEIAIAGVVDSRGHELALSAGSERRGGKTVYFLSGDETDQDFFLEASSWKALLLKVAKRFELAGKVRIYTDTGALKTEADIKAARARPMDGPIRPKHSADTAPADRVSDIVGAGRERALVALRPELATTHARALAGVATGGQRTASELERLTRTAANEAATAAVRASAEANGVGLLWIAERDACVHCLAYAGRYAAPGETFPDDLTFGEKPLAQDDPLRGPPLHPNCRCTVRPWDPSWDAELPAALEREARRSIVLGFKLDTEPDSTRLRAADRLLTAGAGLPKTVVARARRAVAQGKFADRRRAPHG